MFLSLVKDFFAVLIDFSDAAPLKLLNIKRDLDWHIKIALHQADISLSPDAHQLPVWPVSYRPFDRWCFYSILGAPGIEAHVLLLLLELGGDLPIGLESRALLVAAAVAGT